MTYFEQTGSHLTALVLFGLASLSAPGLAGAHGAPEAENIPDGIVKARITQQPEIAGLSAIILDAPRPGILLRYQGEKQLTVLGIGEEAFLQFQGKEVWANSQSALWQALPERQQEPGASGWVPLSQSGSYGWMDPRLDAKLDHHGESASQWTIRIRTGDGDIHRIAGTLTYQTLNASR